jgi:hypothetical protein
VCERGSIRLQSPIAAAPMRFVGINGICLDSNNRITHDGNPIQNWFCNDTPPQIWTVANCIYQGAGQMPLRRRRQMWSTRR